MNSNYRTEGIGLRRRAVATIAATGLLLSIFGGSAQAANSRDFSVTVGAPTPASQGGATKFDVDVVSTDNQTIAHVVLSIPAAGQTWPAGLTITNVFGADASACAPTNGTSLRCDFGNLRKYGSRSISILASVDRSVSAGDDVSFSASAETNNENGKNLQVKSGVSSPLHVLPFDPNGISTFALTGHVGTTPLGGTDAGNLETVVNLITNNGGKGNAVAIVEGLDEAQPAYCVSLELDCRSDFADVAVNDGSNVTPYLEVTLRAQVLPHHSWNHHARSWYLKKAFVLHILDDGTVDPGFPLMNREATSCAAHPNLIPCADFSLSDRGVLTITVHTRGNGKFQF